MPQLAMIDMVTHQPLSHTYAGGTSDLTVPESGVSGLTISLRTLPTGQYNDHVLAYNYVDNYHHDNHAVYVVSQEDGDGGGCGGSAVFLKTGSSIGMFSLFV